MNTDIDYIQDLYRRCLESVAPAENKRMQERTQLTWRDTKIAQKWGRMNRWGKGKEDEQV